MTDDPGVKEALGFLMTREIAHQQSFEKALYSIQNNFPPGKLAGMKPFDQVYFNMSIGEGDMRGPWNNHGTFDYRDAEPAVDGGDGQPMVKMDEDSAQLVQQSATRLMSDPQSDPTTGAMLGADPSRALVAADDASRAATPAAKSSSPRTGSTTRRSGA
jgi:Mn-containing catalase